jgi:endo-1,4-beta-xylanase
MRRFLLVALALASASLYAAKGPEPTAAQIPIWDGPPPHATENPGPEVQEVGGRVANVSIPSIDVYLPDPAKATGQATLICSGGGYGRLASGSLGRGAAEIFLPKGIAVFSLKYRTKPPSQDVRRDAAADGRRAMQLIRSRAKEWHLDPNRIGMVGFSAGSNLILHVVTNDTAGDPSSADPVARESGRPDFIALCAAWPSGQQAKSFKIDGTIPPAFFAHAKDDNIARLSFAEDLVAAWKDAAVPVELDVYETGGHMAFNFPGSHAADWTGKFLVWLSSLK